MILLVVSMGAALFISALCSLFEATLLSFTPSQVATLSRRHPHIGAIWQRFKANIERPIAVVLIVNTAAHTIGATVAGAQYEEVFPGRSIALFSLIFTYLMLQFTEILPKTLGVRYSLRLAPFTAPLLEALIKVAAPVLYLIHLINRPFEGRRRNEQKPSSPEEIAALAAAARLSDQIDPHQERIIRVASRFSGIRIRQVMTPRTRLVALRVDQPIDEVLRVVQTSAYTRFPLYEGDIDNIIGFVHMKDLFLHLQLMAGRLRFADDKTPEGHAIAVVDGKPGSAVHVIGGGDIDLRKIRRDILFVPEMVPVPQVLRQFQDTRIHMAAVVDEYGATQGIVTLEDAIEEFVGEIEDEFDTAAPPTFMPEGQGYSVSGQFPIHELLERLNLPDVDTGDVDTVSGYVTHHLGRFPEAGDTVALGPFTVRVLSVQRRQVRRVSVLPTAPATTEAATPAPLSDASQ